MLKLFLLRNYSNLKVCQKHDHKEKHNKNISLFPGKTILPATMKTNLLLNVLNQ